MQHLFQFLSLNLSFRIAKFEREFFKLVDVSLACTKVEMSQDVVDFIYKYWILKRRAGGNKVWREIEFTFYMLLLIKKRECYFRHVSGISILIHFRVRN